MTTIIVIRDPDASNQIEVFETPALVIDIDLGYMDLTDPDEWADWMEGRVEQAKQIPQPEARELYRRVIDAEAARHEYEPIDWELDL